MGVYDGIIQGLNEAIEFNEGKTEARIKEMDDAEMLDIGESEKNGD